MMMMMMMMMMMIIIIMDTVCGKPVTYGLDREVGLITSARIFSLICDPHPTAPVQPQ
jgi:hypothetical protein